MNFNQIVQRGGSVVRGGMNIANWVGRQVAGNAAGLAQRVRPARAPTPATPPPPKPDMDDVTLARKVETDIFRNRRALKSSVNVNAVDGVVWLRGEVKHPGQIRSLEQEVLAIPEVRDVENLLHLPKTPAPTRPRRQQRTRSSTKRPTPRTRTEGRITDDRTDAIERSAEPSPVEHASDGEGRTPVPMGSQGGNNGAA
jgi:BON domain